MFVGVLQFELVVRSSNSLKDKRRVLKSLKDRLHREHLCAVAEVGAAEHHRLAVVGVSVVSGSAAHAGGMLDAIAGKLPLVKNAELGETRREVASIDSLTPCDIDAFGDPVLAGEDAAALAHELLERGEAARLEAKRSRSLTDEPADHDDGRGAA